MAEMNADRAPVLHVQVDSKVFVDHDGTRTAVLRNITFRARASEVVMITGPSGCGKTTLLNVIADLDRDYAGRIVLPTPEPGNLPLSYVFQESRLLPWRTVRENVMLPCTMRNRRIASTGCSNACRSITQQRSTHRRYRSACAGVSPWRAPLRSMHPSC